MVTELRLKDNERRIENKMLKRRIEELKNLSKVPVTS